MAEEAVDQNVVRALTQKREELEALRHEIQNLERQVPARMRTKSLADNADEDSRLQIMRLDNSLRAKIEEVDMLHDKVRTQEEMVAAKQRALAKTGEDLLHAQDKIDALEKELRDNHQEMDKLQNKYKELSATRSTEASNFRGLQGTKDEDYFHLVDKLENEIRTKDAEISELWSDRKTLDGQLKRKDAVIDKLTAELKQQSQSYEDVGLMEGKVRELTKQFEELQRENKLLNNLCRVKTQHIEKLTQELADRSHSEEYVRQLEVAVRNKEHVIEQMQAQNEAHARKMKARDDEIREIAEKAASSSQGMSFRAWYEERKGLKAEIERLQDARAAQEKIIKSQHERVNQLAGRLETLTRSLSDTAHLSPRHAAMVAAAPRRPGGGVFVDEDGQEMVAAELFDALARDVHTMKLKLEEKENELIEKDDIIECFERKNEILAKTFTQETKNNKRKASEMAGEISHLKALLHQKEKDLKEREQQLKMDNIRLKKQLGATSSTRRTANGSFVSESGEVNQLELTQ